MLERYSNCTNPPNHPRDDIQSKHKKQQPNKPLTTNLQTINHASPTSSHTTTTTKTAITTYRKTCVSAPSASNSKFVDVIPPAASRADAKNNILIVIVGVMWLCRSCVMLALACLLAGLWSEFGVGGVWRSLGTVRLVLQEAKSSVWVLSTFDSSRQIRRTDNQPSPSSMRLF